MYSCFHSPDAPCASRANVQNRSPRLCRIRVGRRSSRNNVASKECATSSSDWASGTNRQYQKLRPCESTPTGNAAISRSSPATSNGPWNLRRKKKSAVDGGGRSITMSSPSQTGCSGTCGNSAERSDNVLSRREDWAGNTPTHYLGNAIACPIGTGVQLAESLEKVLAMMEVPRSAQRAPAHQTAARSSYSGANQRVSGRVKYRHVVLPPKQEPQ